MDAAEDEEKKEVVRRINVGGTQYIADACKACGCKLLYLSTDYVFNGQGETPWTPDCKDYAELNIYGQSKLDGELAVRDTMENYFMVRIFWYILSGQESNSGGHRKSVLRIIICDPFRPCAAWLSTAAPA